MTIATEHKFGEIMNNDSGSSTSLECTRMKQINLTCVHGDKYKGEGFANNGEFAIWTSYAEDTFYYNTFKPTKITKKERGMFNIHIPIWQHGSCIHLAMATKPPQILINSLYPNKATLSVLNKWVYFLMVVVMEVVVDRGNG